MNEQSLREILALTVTIGIYVGAVLGIIGIVKGGRGEVVIYNGARDIVFTFGFLVSAVLLLASDSKSIGAALFLLFMTLWVRESVLANGWSPKLILVLPAKFLGVFAVVLFGAIALGGAATAADELKKSNGRKAAQAAAASALGAIAAVWAAKRVKSLIRDRISERTPPLIAGAQRQR